MRHVVVIDDDKMSLVAVRNALSEYYKVTALTSGLQALTFFESNDCDLILLDYEMPIMDGPRVFQHLAEKPQTQDIPVIFLTGNDDAADIKRVLELKPAGYILKPIVAQDLQDRLAAFFAQ